jgi:uncharacterized protein (DUF302 family)
MSQSISENGVISKPSPYSVSETINKLVTALTLNGIKIFAKIDQKSEAESVGLELRPTELLLFGDPKAGTPLMNAFPSIAIDLPLKAVAWEANDGKVWISYNSPAYLKVRHGLPEEPFKLLENLIDKALE